MLPRLATSAAIVLLAETSALACSCGERPSIDEAFRDAVIVATGVVLSATPSVVAGTRISVPEGSPTPRFFPVISYEIAPTRLFKGTAADRIRLTHFGCCICEETLEPAREYVLFIMQQRDIADAYMVSFCDPNGLVVNSSQTLRKLGQLGKPSPPLPVQPLTAFERLASARDRAWNVALRAYWARRMGDNPFIEDPLEPLIASPWFRFISVVLGASAAAVLAIAVRRRIRRRRPNST